MSQLCFYQEKITPTAEQIIARLNLKENRLKRKKDHRHAKRQQAK